MQLSGTLKHMLPPLLHTHLPRIHVHTHTDTHTQKRTLFCFRAPFSFIWGQSLPVMTALISATGTADRTGIRTTTTTTPWQLQHPRWFKWLKVKIIPRSVIVYALWSKLMLTEWENAQLIWYSVTICGTYICPAKSRGGLRPEGSLPNLHNAGLYGSETDGNTKTYLYESKKEREGQTELEEDKMSMTGIVWACMSHQGKLGWPKIRWQKVKKTRRREKLQMGHDAPKLQPNC